MFTHAHTSKMASKKRAGKVKDLVDNKKSKFTKLTQREHVLHRPDMYTGSTSPETNTHVLSRKEGPFVKKDVNIAPGFLQIVEEAIVNAADRVSCRHEDGNNIRINTTKISIDIEDNTVIVANDGCGIPIEYLEEHKMYTVELVFGNLLTSSNYDDTKKRLNCGRQGLGVKLLNIFSKKFTVETIDANRSKKYKQVFENNMIKVNKPKITEFSGKPYTRVTSEIDLERFGIKGERISNTTIDILRRRAHEIQMCSMDTIKVTFNGETMKTPSPEKYISMYGIDKSRVVSMSTPRWKVAVAFTPDNGEFKHYSFVNSTCTPQGGTHVSHIMEPLLKSLTETLRKKFKSPKLRPGIIKECLTLVLSSHIENPTFSSQTKDQLTLHSRDFGSSFDIPDNFYTKLLKCGVSDYVHEVLKSKDSSLLKTTDGTKKSTITGIPKLSDAKWAGTKKSKECYLMVTEGDSALGMALSATAVIGRDKFGAWPARGKVLNVRDANPSVVANNVEISNLKKILGLKNDMVYTDTSSLRYGGGIVILTDADNDGYHIKGLLLNMFQVFWPSLLDLGYVHTINTPIVRATKGKTVKLFYTENDFNTWESIRSNKSHLYNVRRLKGLGSSSPAEAREYFSDIYGSLVKYTTNKESDESLSLAFDKKRAADRKVWLAGYSNDNTLDISSRSVGISDFVNKELIHFSTSDMRRSIPSSMDGFKNSQRKALCGSFMKGIVTSDAKVAQITGFIADKMEYHHGETSLSGTIIGMAQSFVGSNNIELLLGKGQFGSRLGGGSDSASPRYIFVQMNPVTSKLFRKEDEAVLDWREEDGHLIEPVHYVPIISTLLVNGSQGIGTGYSTSIPKYNPRDLITNVRSRIKGTPLKTLVPHFRGFTGKIEESTPGSYITSGIYEKNRLNVSISELPVGTWSSQYKQYLEGLVEKKSVSSYTESCTDTDVVFEVVLCEDLSHDALVSLLKLTSTFRTSNMHCFDKDNVIHRYETTGDLESEHFNERLSLYKKRKEFQIKVLEHENNLISEKCRFFEFKIDNTIRMENRKYDDVISDLESLGFQKIGKDFMSTDKNFDYLTNIKLFDVTEERVGTLKIEMESKKKNLRNLREKSIENIWLDELKELEKILS